MADTKKSEGDSASTQEAVPKITLAAPPQPSVAPIISPRTLEPIFRDSLSKLPRLPDPAAEHALANEKESQSSSDANSSSSNSNGHEEGDAQHGKDDKGKRTKKHRRTSSTDPASRLPPNLDLEQTYYLPMEEMFSSESTLTSATAYLPHALEHEHPHARAHHPHHHPHHPHHPHALQHPHYHPHAAHHAHYPHHYPYHYPPYYHHYPHQHYYGHHYDSYHGHHAHAAHHAPHAAHHGHAHPAPSHAPAPVHPEHPHEVAPAHPTHSSHRPRSNSKSSLLDAATKRLIKLEIQKQLQNYVVDEDYGFNNLSLNDPYYSSPYSSPYYSPYSYSPYAYPPPPPPPPPYPYYSPYAYPPPPPPPPYPYYPAYSGYYPPPPPEGFPFYPPFEFGYSAPQPIDPELKKRIKEERQKQEKIVSLESGKPPVPKPKPIIDTAPWWEHAWKYNSTNPTVLEPYSAGLNESGEFAFGSQEVPKGEKKGDAAENKAEAPVAASESKDNAKEDKAEAK